jgi:hypothetical protein
MMMMMRLMPRRSTVALPPPAIIIITAAAIHVMRGGLIAVVGNWVPLLCAQLEKPTDFMALVCSDEGVDNNAGGEQQIGPPFWIFYFVVVQPKSCQKSSRIIAPS